MLLLTLCDVNFDDKIKIVILLNDEYLKPVFEGGDDFQVHEIFIFTYNRYNYFITVLVC